ncbi:sigma factor-like helix-turn-helix DNA-binding protein [Paludisphaera borealis]|uniref:sigma factor-like helix-turn-helix DNA-binding protein n=1 Tax=Paludisphaera borealis TaxID=1387353 RepID=UPI0035A32DF0
MAEYQPDAKPPADRTPAKDRAVVLARYWDGLSQSQAGERLKVTRARAWQRERRALDRLREPLAG